MTSSITSSTSLPPQFGRWAQRDPERAAHMQERIAQWQSEHPGEDFRTAMHARFESRVREDFASWSAANPGGTVDQFVQAKAAERQQRMAERGIQVPQAVEGSMLSRMTERIRALLGA